MADSNVRMVKRAHVKQGLLQFAPPSVIRDLLEGIEDKNDRLMLEVVYLELTGEELPQ